MLGLLALATGTAEQALLWAGSIAAGMCAAAFVYPFVRALVAPRSDAGLTPNEQARRAGLRERSDTFRLFEPLVAEIVATLPRNERLNQLQRDLRLLDPEAGWLAPEYFATRRVESWGVFLAVLVALGVGIDEWSAGAVLGVGAGWAYPHLATRRVAQRAQAYRNRIDARLPLVADLMGLVLESGNLPEALEVATGENRGHPLGDELERALEANRRNPQLSRALQEMADRVGSADLTEFVFMLVTALALGTGVREPLQNMAERLRVRRVQRLERLAEVATVKIAAPALFVMLACLIIIMAPFLLIGYVQGR